MKHLLLVCLLFGLTVTATMAQTETRERRAEAQEIDDPIATLRTQLEAASMIQDCNRLRLKLAEELVKTGQKREAVAELFAVLNANGFDPIGFYNLGNAFARLDESEAAITAYRRAIEQRKGGYSRAQNNLGVVLLRQGRWDEAYDALITALKLENFRYAEASYNLGRLYAARGQSDLAAREWRRAIVVDPKHDAARQSLARGGDEDVIAVAKAPAVKSPKSTTAKAPPASGPVRRLTLNQTSFDLLQRARDASERGKMLDAVDNYRRLLNREGGYFAPANLELSYALLGLKRYDEALAQLRQVSERDGARYPVSYFHLARLYELKGELKLAEAAFSQALDANVSGNIRFLLDLSRVREKQGNFKGALEAMEQYVNLVQQQGEKPAWSEERLAALRAKAQ